MKMRHHAAPGNPTDSPDIPQDQRLHLRLKVGQQTEKVFWFRKVCVMELVERFIHANEPDGCNWESP